MADLTGKQLEQYYLDRPLGRGASATVYLARHVPTGQTCVVKVLLKPRDADMAQQFREGGRLAAGLQHPNIVRVLRVGEDQGYSFVAMEYLSGGTLEVLLQGRPWAWKQAEPVLRQVAAALDHAHARGIVHRDVKPSNILFSQDHKRAVLSDFGIAQSLLRGQPGVQPDRSGTLLYMSPEQCQGLVVGATSDIYSLAVMAYQMLTGRLPFNAEEPLALIHQHISQPPPAPRSLNPRLKPPIEAALLRGMAKDPGQRYRTAAEFVDALAGRGAASSTQQRRLRAVLVIGALLIGFVLGLWAWTEFGRERSPSPTPPPLVIVEATTPATEQASTPSKTSTIASTSIPTPAATDEPTSTIGPSDTATPTAPPATKPPTAPVLPLAACPDPQIARITSPRQGQVITGPINVTGTAAGPNFARFEFFYKRPDESVWHQYLGAKWTKAVADGLLDEWNPHHPNLKLPAGDYQLLLRVVDKTANYKECVVNVSVQ